MRPTRMYIAFLGVTICCGNLANGEMKNAEVDFKPFVRDMWTDEATFERGLEVLADIPVDQLPHLLAAQYDLDKSNPEGFDYAFEIMVLEFSKRMDAAKWREIVSVILTDDEYPKNLKVSIARTRYHAVIMDNDVESIIDMLEDAVKPVDELWVYAQMAIASALRSSRSAALRASNMKAMEQVEHLAEKQVRSIMYDLLRLGIRDDDVYRHATATTLAMYRLIVPAVFESELIKGFSKAELGVPNELQILESIYRSSSVSPSESGPVRKFIQELEDKAELQQLQISEQDRKIINLIVAE